MLQVSKRRSREITQVYCEGNALFLRAEAGVIRVMPQTEKMFRVSYTEKGNFPESQGEELQKCQEFSAWDFDEDQESIYIDTGYLHVTVCKSTGSIDYRKQDGTFLLAERNQESKNTEAFDSYKTVINENAQIEEIHTADGIKSSMKTADRVFDRTLYHTRLFLDFSPNERLYGLGQAEEGCLNLRGTMQYLHQANLKIAIPFLLSDKGYGIFLSTQSPAIFNDTQYGSYLYTEADEYLDYYFMAGDCLDEVIGSFRQLTGKAAMLPKWAFGYIQSQERYESEEELLETARTFRSRGIGLDVLVLDWLSWKDNLWGQKTFDDERFSDPLGMINSLHEMDVHFMMSIWPNMAPQSDNYKEFKQKGLLLPGSQIYDAFSEKGRRLYWNQIRQGLFCHGVDAWWCDSCEPITPEWGRKMKPEAGQMYYDFVKEAGNFMPIRLANAYGLYHAKAIYEGQRDCTEDKRVINLIRSSYAGCQKYGTISWSGDIYADWDTLKKQIVAGLNFCASGMPYWTLDIGAFFVKKGEEWFWNGHYENGNADPGYRELYVRWLQYGAFLPIFRSHGTDCRREPWNFGDKGDPFYDAILSAIRLRYHLLPYIYSLAGNVWRKNGTIMRLLAFDFPEDEKAKDICDEYMFGPALLVCPVTEPMYYSENGIPLKKTDRSRKIYLPAGTDWYDMRTGEKYKGGLEIKAAAEIDRIPVYVKAGSILPVMASGECTKQMEGCEITLKIYSGESGSFTLYEDAGDGYGYENGEYCLTHIIYCDDDQSVVWETEKDKRFRKGDFKIQII